MFAVIDALGLLQTPTRVLQLRGATGAYLFGAARALTLPSRAVGRAKLGAKRRP